MKLPEFEDRQDARSAFKVGPDDFDTYTSGGRWTSLTSGGTVAVSSSAVGGVVVLTATNTQGNQVAFHTTQTLFKMAAGKDFEGEVCIQYAEANTNTVNLAFGFADNFGTGLMGTGTTGPAINSTGCLIYKLSGTTTWAATTVNNGATLATTANETAGGSTYVRLGIKGRAMQSTGNYEVTYHLASTTGPSKPLTISGDTNYKPILHRIAYASAAAMKFGVFLRTNSNTQEVVNVDWAFAAGVR